MNLPARMPSVVSSSTSSSPGKTWYGYQDPVKSVVVDDRSGQPNRLSPASQEWKSEAVAHDRSGKPDEISWNAMQQVRPHHEEPLLDGNAQSVRYGEIIHDGSWKPESVNYQEEAESETFVMGSDAAEFVNKVKDQVRERQKRMSNVADSGEEHSIIWGMFMAATMNAATFMGKNFVDTQNFIMNSKDLTLKQMFDITLKLVSEQDEINNWTKFNGERIHGNNCHCLVMKLLSIFSAQKSMSSQILCCALEGSINIRNPTKFGRKGLNGSQLIKATETMTESMESRLNSSGTSFQDSQRCSSAVKSQIY